MVKTNSFWFPSSDGLHRIYAFEWLPEGRPRGVIQLVHGISEYTERYDRFARFLAEQGFLVCGEDLLGHGRTAQAQGPFGYFAKYDGWTLVTADLRTLRQTMGERYPGIPYVLFGHSMGSFLVRTYLCRYPGTVDMAILSGTGQEPRPLIRGGHLLTGLLVGLGSGSRFSKPIFALSMGTFNKPFAAEHPTHGWISRMKDAQDAYLTDPLCRFAPTNGMFHDLLGGMLYISDRRPLKQMDPSTPVYFFSGDRDPVGQMGKGVQKVYEMFRAAGCTDVTLKLYPEGRHEMLREINYEQVQQDLLDWLEKKLRELEKKVDFNE